MHSTATSMKSHIRSVKVPCHQIFMRVRLYCVCSVFLFTKKTWLLSLRRKGMAHFKFIDPKLFLMFRLESSAMTYMSKTLSLLVKKLNWNFLEIAKTKWSINSHVVLKSKKASESPHRVQNVESWKFSKILRGFPMGLFEFCTNKSNLWAFVI